MLRAAIGMKNQPGQNYPATDRLPQRRQYQFFVNTVVCGPADDLAGI